ncbi:MAG: hypothetical protein E7C86_00640 [Paeniclostridium sordellii]|uniref:Uncharacterized protein n=1 Tax=Paeniclostridium hominis TaxID=2764329 RepID=A0ABR7K510_9FIRM|nr:MULTISPECIES: hypothetical protein [Paeniclostridium]MBC6004197.1 hypothetical protein [Paeniclostridium hominis]MDU2591109.1 hypothetical protein [Paeniclostridium sordellii]
MNNNILCINKYIDDIEKNFLETGDKKYIDICKKFYGANLEKISIYIWTLHIMDQFRDNIIKNCENIHNIKVISKEIYELVKEDRKKLVLYAYLKGHVFGYNNYRLVKEIKSIMLNDNIKSISNDDLKENKDIDKYLNIIRESELNKESIKLLIQNIEIYYLKSIENKLLNISSENDKYKILSITKELMEKDVINKYNEGILHGITQKINKKAWKNDKMNI